jgi:hypothetical protein
MKLEHKEIKEGVIQLFQNYIMQQAKQELELNMIRERN